MRRVRVLQEAAEEAAAAANWYENERAGLGAEFFGAVEAAIDLIEEEIVPLSRCPSRPALKARSDSFSEGSPMTSLWLNGPTRRLSSQFLITLENPATGANESARNGRAR